jgi:hypothetical membrane protein
MASLIGRYGGYAGFLSPSIFIIFTLAAILSHPGYSFSSDYLSYLGIYPASYVLFNAGLAISGISGFIFAIFLWLRYPAGLSRAGAFLLASSMMFFTLLSVFTADAFTIHIFLSGLFFVLVFLSLILIGVGLWKEQIGAFSLLMAALILPLPLTDLHPLAEHLAAGAILLWVIVMALHINRKDETEEYQWLWAYY